jgi:hypothetical protein
MKKIVSLILVLLTGLMITGCNLPAAPEDDYQICVEKQMMIDSFDVLYGDAAKYKNEYLKQTKCKTVESCNRVAFITYSDCD